jgi:hypothetical protein
MLQKDTTPADLFLAFKKRMTERWQARNERYLKKISEAKAKQSMRRKTTGLLGDDQLSSVINKM